MHLWKIVSRDKVALEEGIVSAPIGTACARVANRLKTPLMIDCAAADENTQRLSA